MTGFFATFLLSEVFLLALGNPIYESSTRLIKTDHDKPAQWMDQSQIWELIRAEVNFMDVTGHNFPIIKPEDANKIEYPTNLQFPQIVTPLLSEISVSRMITFVNSFSQFYNRYYLSQTGIASQQFLLGQITASTFGYEGNATISEITHAWEGQKSIVVRLEGSDPELRAELVVLGAHQDSINKDGSGLQAPGADDNASGSALVLETLRVLVDANFIPKRSIEFHFYAAEEVGLRGSAEIARAYKESNVTVVSVVNYDVPGYYVQGRPEIRLVTDFVNPELTSFLSRVVEGYVGVPWQYYTCGYACSDHASWFEYGFPAARPAEAVYHPGMHTITDVISAVSFEQVRDFTKLAVGYVVELGEPGMTTNF